MSSQTGKAILTELPIQVATYDIDFAGVVSNIVYIRWMEDMRLAMTRPPHNLPLITLMKDGFGTAPAITKTEIDYRRSIHLGDEVIGSAWCSKLTHRSVVISYEFHVDNRLMVHGKQSGCFIDLATRKFAKTPQSWKDIYEESLRNSSLKK